MRERFEAFWRLLDAPGHDACVICKDGGAWLIDGMAVFRRGGETTRLAYTVECDRQWRTRRARVRGWAGERRIDLAVERAADGEWSVDGAPASGLADVIDVDLGFTPATNTIAIRRMALAVGEESPAGAAWIDTSDWRLKRLRQVYRRVAADSFDYRSPDHGYHERLTVDVDGLVVDYPGLWTLVPRAD